MKKLTVFCDSDDGAKFVVTPGDAETKARVAAGFVIVLLDLARIRELKKYFTRLEREVAKRPKDVPARPKKWVYGEES